MWNCANLFQKSWNYVAIAYVDDFLEKNIASRRPIKGQLWKFNAYFKIDNTFCCYCYEPRLDNAVTYVLLRGMASTYEPYRVTQGTVHTTLCDFCTWKMEPHCMYRVFMTRPLLSWSLYQLTICAMPWLVRSATFLHLRNFKNSLNPLSSSNRNWEQQN